MAIQNAEVKIRQGTYGLSVDENLGPTTFVPLEAQLLCGVNRIRRTGSDIRTDFGVGGDGQVAFTLHRGAATMAAASTLTARHPTYIEIDMDKVQLPEGVTVTMELEEGFAVDGKFQNSLRSPSPARPNFLQFRTPKRFVKTDLESSFTQDDMDYDRFRDNDSTMDCLTSIYARGVINPGQIAAIEMEDFEMNTFAVSIRDIIQEMGAGFQQNSSTLTSRTRFMGPYGLTASTSATIGNLRSTKRYQSSISSSTSFTASYSPDVGSAVVSMKAGTLMNIYFETPLEVENSITVTLPYPDMNITNVMYWAGRFDDVLFTQRSHRDARSRDFAISAAGDNNFYIGRVSFYTGEQKEIYKNQSPIYNQKTAARLEISKFETRPKYAFVTPQVARPGQTRDGASVIAVDIESGILMTRQLIDNPGFDLEIQGMVSAANTPFLTTPFTIPDYAIQVTPTIMLTGSQGHGGLTGPGINFTTGSNDRNYETGFYGNGETLVNASITLNDNILFFNTQPYGESRGIEIGLSIPNTAINTGKVITSGGSSILVKLLDNTAYVFLTTSKVPASWGSGDILTTTVGSSLDYDPNLDPDAYFEYSPGVFTNGGAVLDSYGYLYNCYHSNGKEYLKVRTITGTLIQDLQLPSVVGTAPKVKGISYDADNKRVIFVSAGSTIHVIRQVGDM